MISKDAMSSALWGHNQGHEEGVGGWKTCCSSESYQALLRLKIHLHTRLMLQLMEFLCDTACTIPYLPRTLHIFYFTPCKVVSHDKLHA